MQNEPTAIVTNRFYRFGLGVALGILIGGGLLLTYTGNLPSSGVPSIILSIMTYAGFAFIAFGYFYKKGGKKTFLGDFVLGVGIGLIVVWFINAGIGNPGAVPLSD